MYAHLFKYYRIIIGCLACFSFIHDSAADGAQNTATIKKINVRCISVDFSLAPVTTLHQLLAPTMQWDDFFNKFTGMKDTEFKNEVLKVHSLIQRNAKVFDLEGGAFIFGSWKWPATQLWLDTLKSEQILFITGSNNQGHAKPMEIHTQACSNHPVGTLQFSFDPNLYPLYVVTADNNQTILTKQAPFATAEF